MYGWMKCGQVSLRGFRNFFQGGPGPTFRKQSGQLFFLVLSQFYSLQRMSNGFLQRKLYFSKDPEGGPTFFRGFNFFPGGGPNANFYRNPYNL